MNVERWQKIGIGEICRKPTTFTENRPRYYTMTRKDALDKQQQNRRREPERVLFCGLRERHLKSLCETSCWILSPQRPCWKTSGKDPNGVGIVNLYEK